MARAKGLSSYPTELWTIVERVAIGGENFERPVDNWEEAARIQGKYYAFRGALRRELDRYAVRTAPEDLGYVKRLQDVLRFTETCVCWYDRVGKGELVVRYMHKDQTPEARALRKMLSAAREGNPEKTTLDLEAEESLKRMMEKLDDDNI